MEPVKKFLTREELLADREDCLEYINDSDSSKMRKLKVKCRGLPFSAEELLADPHVADGIPAAAELADHFREILFPAADTTVRDGTAAKRFMEGIIRSDELSRPEDSVRLCLLKKAVRELGGCRGLPTGRVCAWARGRMSAAQREEYDGAAQEEKYALAAAALTEDIFEEGQSEELIRFCGMMAEGKLDVEGHKERKYPYLFAILYGMTVALHTENLQEEAGEKDLDAFLRGFAGAIMADLVWSGDPQGSALMNGITNNARGINIKNIMEVAYIYAMRKVEGSAGAIIDEAERIAESAVEMRGAAHVRKKNHATGGTLTIGYSDRVENLLGCAPEKAARFIADAWLLTEEGMANRFEAAGGTNTARSLEQENDGRRDVLAADVLGRRVIDILRGKLGELPPQEALAVDNMDEWILNERLEGGRGIRVDRSCLMGRILTGRMQDFTEKRPTVCVYQYAVKFAADMDEMLEKAGYRPMDAENDLVDRYVLLLLAAFLCCEDENPAQ